MLKFLLRFSSSISFSNSAKSFFFYHPVLNFRLLFTGDFFSLTLGFSFRSFVSLNGVETNKLVNSLLFMTFSLFSLGSVFFFLQELLCSCGKLCNEEFSSEKMGSIRFFPEWYDFFLCYILAFANSLIFYVFRSPVVLIN